MRMMSLQELMLQESERKARLAKSKFRSSFQLTAEDLAYIEKNGLEKIRSHAADFLSKRLAPEQPLNDGKQTPFRGHPAFKAQHATGTCCRGCLFKWYRLSKNRQLTELEIKYLTDVLMDWIQVHRQI